MAEKGRRRLGFEMKLSSAPAVSKGFRQALADVKPQRTYLIAPVETGYPVAKNVEVFPAHELGNGIPDAT